MTQPTAYASRSTVSVAVHFTTRFVTALAFACALAAPALATDKAADHADQMKMGKQLFTKGAVPACAICHTLEDAGAEGAIGPVLDELKPDAERVIKALQAGLGVMPSYEGKLTEAQMKALATYVSHASGGEK